MHQDDLVVLGLKITLGISAVGGAYAQQQTVVGSFEFAYLMDHP